MRKKNTRKRAIALIMASMMAASLAGCGGGSGDSGSNSSASAASSGEIDTSSHEVINMLVLGNRPTNGRLEAMLEQLNEILTEKVNAELEYTYVEWTDWQTQYNLQLLSGDTSLDLITTATDWLFGWENVIKGAFMPLSEEMLQTYAPQTYAQVTEDDDWDICKYEDEIYFIPEDNYIQYTNHGMFYRGDWAAEAGIPDGTITEFEQLTTYFQWVKENQPDCIPWDVSGKNNTAGILGGYITSHSDYVCFNGVSVGNYTDFWGVMQSDGNTVTSPYMESDVLYDAAELMKEWNDMGVWREDVLNFDGDSREEMYAGTSGADQHHAQTYYSTIVPNMESKQPGSDPKFYYWGMENQNVSHPLKLHQACAISANSQHPERALMVYDLLRNDEECYRLLNYGIEGEDYLVTDDGKLARPEGYDSSTDALDSNFWLGRNDDLELQDSTWWDGTQDFIANLNSIAYDYPFENLIIDTTSIESQQAALANVLSKYIPQLAYGKFDDPAAAIDQMREELLAAGYEDVKASIQEDLDAFVAEHGDVQFVRDGGSTTASATDTSASTSSASAASASTASTSSSSAE